MLCPLRSAAAFGGAGHRDLKEREASVSVVDPCHKYGVDDANIYKWKAKFSGMEVSQAKRLKTLEDENTQLLAAAMLGNAALKDLLGKKW